MFEKFKGINSDSIGTVKYWKQKTGRKVIGVMPAYFPKVVITALDAYPVAYIGENIPIVQADTYLQSFSCTTTRTILEQALKGDMDYVDGFIFTTMCDNQQNLSEIFKKLFKNKRTINFMIPFASSIPARSSFTKAQMEKTISALEQITGNIFSLENFNKAKAIYERLGVLINELYDLRRRSPAIISAYDFYSIINAGLFLPVDEYIKLLEPVIHELKNKPVNSEDNYRVIISGITAEPLSLTKIFDEVGLAVADDDLTNGSRLYSKGVLQGIDQESLDRYLFGGEPCSTLYDPSRDRKEHLLKKAKAHKATVVFWQIKFCEPEAFDRPDIIDHLKQHNVKTHVFEVELQMNSFESIKTRLQAFKELMEV
ncbi:MAG: 2-hydroxyacyl-CoA dehydratase family protein [Deltaproteobacteria bacterium]|nr:2-hydroxyacyl-CoA dehydratase family protein [Deltaproteobacteria bacterium]MCL5791659.1 2-hydroxyacyl-CoA dehydratase family protein [Deltaproteobacteria bacterium]